MKNLFSIVMSFIFFIHFSGFQFYEGRQYICLGKEVHDVPKLLEFFSFYCPHCYHFEEVYHISQAINNRLPRGVHIVKYHVDFLGRLGKELTHAWAVAMVLGVEDEISSLIFYALHHKKSIHGEKDIRLVFLEFGISDEEYDLIWNSIKVKEFILKQKQAVFDFQLHGVPVIFVNGRYMIKNDRLDTSSMDVYIKQCVAIISVLMLKL